MSASFMEQNTEVQKLCARLRDLLSEQRGANVPSGQVEAHGKRQSESHGKAPVPPAGFLFAPPLILGIDGMCGAGKTSLAAFLSERYSCSVVHADDFFLPPELRTAERLSEPGGNIHYERLMEEVIRPLLHWKEKAGSEAFQLKTPAQTGVPSCEGVSPLEWAPSHEEMFSHKRSFSREGASGLPSLSYRRFSCADMAYEKDPIVLPLTPLVLIEGSYSLRPEFRAAYDLSVFLSCSEEAQRERILRRNGKERLSMFESRWIPMENRYFDFFQIRDKADLILHT